MRFFNGVFVMIALVCFVLRAEHEGAVVRQRAVVEAAPVPSAVEASIWFLRGQAHGFLVDEYIRWNQSQSSDVAPDAASDTAVEVLHHIQRVLGREFRELSELKVKEAVIVLLQDLRKRLGNSRGVVQERFDRFRNNFRADEKLRRAKQSGERELLEQVVEEYPLTSAGREALGMLATLYLDRGKYSDAVIAFDLLERLHGELTPLQSYMRVLSRARELDEITNQVRLFPLGMGNMIPRVESERGQLWSEFSSRFGTGITGANGRAISLESLQRVFEERGTGLPRLLEGGHGNQDRMANSIRYARLGDPQSLNRILDDGERVVQMSAGDFHNCAITQNRSVVCWGGNDYGQVEIPEGKRREIALGGGATQLVVGAYHGCAITQNRSVVCWGVNNQGQCEVPEGKRREIALGGGAAQLVVGTSHTCALTQNRSVVCWGDNSIGQVEIPEGKRREIVLAGGATRLVAGRTHTCALTQDRRVICWGDNSIGQGEIPEGKRREIALGGGVTQLVAGIFHTCALTQNRSAVCWGDNNQDQSEIPEEKRREIALAGGATQLVAGDYHNCALTQNRSIVCWGSNRASHSEIPEEKRREIALGGGATQLIAGDYHTCALTQNRSVVCWGVNNQDQCEIPEEKRREIALGGGVTQLVTGREHNCAITQNRSVVCWGSNKHGQSNYPQSRQRELDGLLRTRNSAP